jgi:CheY-like chemotaxis protein
MNSVPYALYAEDDANTAQLFLSILSQHNPAFKVVHVRDGEETLEFLRSRGRFDGREPQNPAVIFLDLEMPWVDGLEVLMEIKGDADFRAIPAVVFAGTLNSEKLKRSYELGANAHVVKPADFRRFSHFVRTLGDFWLTINEAPTACVRLI